MVKKLAHYKDFDYIKNLLVNGYETELFTFMFTDDTPNSVLVTIIDKSTQICYDARFGLSKKGNATMATLTGYNAIFFWNDFGSRKHTS
jgi:hypothetical protein